MVNREEKRVNVLYSLRFYLLRCIDDADVVSKLQWSQHSSEDGEGEGSRHRLQSNKESSLNLRESMNKRASIYNCDPSRDFDFTGRSKAPELSFPSRHLSPRWQTKWPWGDEASPVKRIKTRSQIVRI